MDTAEAEQPESVRDRIRRKTFASRIKSKVIEFEGEKIVVKQPSRSDYDGFDDKVSNLRKNALLIVKCAFEVDANGVALRPLYEASDVDGFMEMGLLDPLCMAITAAINELSSTKKLEEEASKSP